MKHLKKLPQFSRQCIYDGLEEGWWNFEYSFIEAPLDQVNITLQEFINSDFTSYANKLHNRMLHQLQLDLGMTNNFRVYQVNSLQVYFLSKNIAGNEYLCIFSSGERQPARYQVFLEAVYLVKNVNDSLPKRIE